MGLQPLRHQEEPRRHPPSLPHCGAPQDATTRYFPSDAERVAVADHAFTGADRVCSSCGTAQSAKAKNCGKCGAPLDGAAGWTEDYAFCAGSGGRVHDGVQPVSRKPCHAHHEKDST